MKYLGGKQRIAKHILPIMLAERDNGQTWVEPFVGGANVIDKVDGPRIGSDINEYLIALLVAVRDGWIPPTTISNELYCEIRSRPLSYPKHLVGFAGFSCSFGAKFWGGFARDPKGGRNYADEGSRALVRQSEFLDGVHFVCCEYFDLDIPEKSLIYCDPPYRGTTGYRVKFDHNKFWDWCDRMAKLGHTVFVSEYSAPNDVPCVFEVPHKTSVNKNVSHSTTEKLFRIIP